MAAMMLRMTVHVDPTLLDQKLRLAAGPHDRGELQQAIEADIGRLDFDVDLFHCRWSVAPRTVRFNRFTYRWRSGTLKAFEEVGMTDRLPSQEDGHLAVAAIRVLRNKQTRPPTPEEIAALLEWTEEETRVVLRGLTKVEILSMHETPFEIRFDLIDHAGLEDLPTEGSKEHLDDEVASFKRRSQSRQEKLEEMLTGGEMDKKKQEKLDALEREFSDFKKKKPKPPL